MLQLNLSGYFQSVSCQAVTEETKRLASHEIMADILLLSSVFKWAYSDLLVL